MSRIGDYALLGDCQSAALVDSSGSVDWWCAPRFDSRSVFARLLDPAAGHFSIRPEAPFTVRRTYVEETMVLETTFTTEGGGSVSPMRWRWGTATGATTSAVASRMSCCGGSRVSKATWRFSWSWRPGWNTGSSSRGCP